MLPCHKCQAYHNGTDCETLRLIPVAPKVEEKVLDRLHFCEECAITYLNTCPTHQCKQ